MIRKFVFCALLLGLIGSGSDSSTKAPSPSAPSPTPTAGTVTLSGTVRDEAGAPLQGASVYVGSDPRRPGFGAATTDLQGRYVVSGIFLGTSPVYVSKPGYVRVSETVVIAEAAVKDFTLRPGVIVGGRTNEAGVGALGNVTITVTSGPNAGLATTSTSWGAYSLSPVAPGYFTIRASKAGYDSIDRAIHATIDTYDVNLTLKWSYGTCLTSVAPVLFDRFASAGGTAGVSVEATAGRSWTAKPGTNWIEVISSASAIGSANVVFRVQPNPIGALDTRAGAIEIRCSGVEGQNVWITQMPNCQTSLEWAATSPQVFPAEGGTGRVLAHNAVGGCRSRDYSEADWIQLVGAGSYMTGEVVFLVAPNTSGAERSGVIVVGETRLQVRQRA